VTFCGKAPPFPAANALVVSWIDQFAAQGLSPKTIRNKLIALATVHRANGWRSIWTYQVRTMLRALLRRGGPTNRKRPLTMEQRLRIAKVLGRKKDLRSIRNLAIVWFGHGGALRRCEVAAAHVEQLEWSPEGITYDIPRSKGDPEGRGQRVCIERDPRRELCPVHALETWLRVSGITAGPIFREITAHGTLGRDQLTADVMGRIVKECIEMIGLDARSYAGHSLRRGWATHAHRTGKSLSAISRQLRHGSLKYTRDYVEGPTPTDVNFSQAVGQ
jgi:integrase